MFTSLPFLALWALAAPIATAAATTTKAPGVHVSTIHGHRTCTVLPRGNKKDDAHNIRKAFEKCAHDSAIVFPDGQVYWIGEKIHAALHNVKIEWRGTWLFSDDTSYWRENSYYVAFQNHRAGFILSGDNIHVDGYNGGGINGNGDVWYDEDKGKSTEGRPMPFVLWNITDSSVDNFFVKQPQFWAINIMNGTNLSFENITSSAVSNNAPAGSNWVQNADGFNTMDAHNITLKNFSYQGGDDCVAIKPRSFDITIDGITCEGGNGIAIGSLGQYLEDNSVENITINNAKMVRSGFPMRWCVYIKTWMGDLVPQASYESEGQPRGGGWGKVRNLLFSNFELVRVERGPYITQDNGGNAENKGTSKMEISDITFRGFTGTLSSTSGRLGEISCSKNLPCYNIYFEDIDLQSASGTCHWTKSGTIFGLPGC